MSSRSLEGEVAQSALPSSLAIGLSQPYLPALDGMRAFAVLLVVFYHFGVPAVPGGLGVLIFFVLSGFLISWLLLKESDQNGEVSLRDFYVRRALRIFPAFYFYAMVVLVVGTLKQRIQWPQAMASLFYVNNYYQAIHGDPNTGLSHTWSLGIEEQFYLLWPLAFLLLRRDLPRMAQFLATSIALLWTYRLLLIFAFHVDQGYIYEAFDSRADHLLIGCLLAVALRAGMFPDLWARICSGPARLGTSGLLITSALLEWQYGTAYRDAIGFVVDPVLIALLIPQWIARRRSFLDWSWLRYLGRISYSVYLWQQLLIDAPRKWLADYSTEIQFTAAIALVVATASGSYFLIERPFLQLKSRFTPARG